MFRCGNRICFFSIQLVNHRDEEIINPPIQSPVTVSSTPRYRESSIPAPIATVQTGQTANACDTGIMKINSRMANNTANIFLNLCLG